MGRRAWAPSRATDGDRTSPGHGPNLTLDLREGDALPSWLLHRAGLSRLPLLRKVLGQLSQSQRKRLTLAGVGFFRFWATTAYPIRRLPASRIDQPWPLDTVPQPLGLPGQYRHKMLSRA